MFLRWMHHKNSNRCIPEGNGGKSRTHIWALKTILEMISFKQYDLAYLWRGNENRSKCFKNTCRKGRLSSRRQIGELFVEVKMVNETANVPFENSPAVMSEKLDENFPYLIIFVSHCKLLYCMLLHICACECLCVRACTCIKAKVKNPKAVGLLCLRCRLSTAKVNPNPLLLTFLYLYLSW